MPAKIGVAKLVPPASVRSSSMNRGIRCCNSPLAGRRQLTYRCCSRCREHIAGEDRQRDVRYIARIVAGNARNALLPAWLGVESAHSAAARAQSATALNCGCSYRSTQPPEYTAVPRSKHRSRRFAAQ